MVADPPTAVLVLYVLENLVQYEMSNSSSLLSPSVFHPFLSNWEKLLSPSVIHP